MLTIFKSTYRWESTLYKVISLYLVCLSVCSYPIRDPEVTETRSEEDERRSNYGLGRKLKDTVQTESLQWIVQWEYARYFNSSWINGSAEDNLSHECLLGPSHFYLWWLDIYGNVRPGLNTQESVALDLSNKGITERNISVFVSADKNQKVYILSLAYNNLSAIPKFFLSILGSTLERLSLMGNNLKTIGSNLPFAVSRQNSFPRMPKLKTIDLRYCQLEYIDQGAFVQLESLGKLILSHNKLQRISLSAFSEKNGLQHLDLSYNFDLVKIKDDTSTERMEPFKSLVAGLYLQPKLFSKHLQKLRFLDLSHTKLHVLSGIALSYLGSPIEQLSLCYTNIPIIAEKMFQDTKLRVLDLSGNQALPTTFTNTSLTGIEDKLEIFSFENAYLKHIHWISKLRNLQILKLRQNNINSIPFNTFSELNNLKIIDLSSNHLSHWYERIIYNHSVQVLDLRDNNINVLSREMIRDFQMVDYLAIGGNMFICNCLLKDFLEIGLRNTLKFDCASPIPVDSDSLPKRFLDQYDTYNRVLNSYLNELRQNHQTISDYFQHKYNKTPEVEVFDSLRKGEVIPQYKSSIDCNSVRNHPNLNLLNQEDVLEYAENNYKVQLLDYSEEDYKCINSNSTKSYNLVELEPCSYIETQLLPNTDVPTDILILYPLLVILSVSVLIIFIYYRGYDIKYFCITFRNVTVLSLLDKDKRKLLNKRKKVTEQDEYLYDVFVSYSEQNRDWVLEHLLPNIEERDGINVCLHERDFKVGLSILENIISCIDQSRTILLVISQSFVSSNWCQFELHLAQHRLLETRREQLVLVLLESIPRITRPRTLQYLMRTKTYLKWPSEKKKASRRINFSQSDIMEQRKLFFKRLKQAIVETP